MTAALFIATLGIANFQAGQAIPGPKASMKTNTVVETIYVADPVAQRIVRLSDVAGNGWATLTASTIGLTSLPVSCVATDKQGRIYFAVGTTVHRVDNMAGLHHVQMSLPSNAGSDVQLFVRNNGWVYATVGNLQVLAYDGVGPTATVKWTGNTSGMVAVNDLYVDSSGVVTISGRTVITGMYTSYPGLIEEIGVSGSPTFYYGYAGPISQLGGVSRDSKGRIYFADISGIHRIDSINGAGHVVMWTSSGAIACWVSGNKIYSSLPTLGKIAVAQTFPSGSLQQFGAIGTGIGQFKNPLDIAVYAFDPRAL